MTLVSTPGDPNADSYFALADAATYFTSRGIATWTGSDTVLENMARRATTYLDNQYRERWVGITALQYQALAWPRVDGTRGYYTGYTQLLLDINGFPIPSTIVPLQVQQAAMEAALLILTGVVLEPNLTRGGAVKQLSETVGPLKTDTIWQDGAPVIDQYMVIQGLLRGLVTSTPGSASGNVRLVRS